MASKKDIKKVVLAYSGGLDTSIIIPWLKENYNNCEVIAVSGDVGQGTELDGLEEKAIKTGASKLYIEDLKEEFITDYIYPTMQAGAVYEGEYLLGTSFARPIIVKRIVEIAKAEGADAICHGCTGKGNDQVRFELTIKHFAPNMPIIAPWREWNIKSREEEIITDYSYPTMQAGAVYEGEYLLGTSFARPIIAKRIVEIAKAEGADAICHGCFREFSIPRTANR